MPLDVTRVFLDGVGVGVLSAKLKKQNKACMVTVLWLSNCKFYQHWYAVAGGFPHNGKVPCFSDVFQKKISKHFWILHIQCNSVDIMMIRSLLVPTQSPPVVLI